MFFLLIKLLSTFTDAEKLNQIKESCIPQKQVSRIPVWNGTTIRNKNDEEARLKYINADIQRSQIPRLCVDITKG